CFGGSSSEIAVPMPSPERAVGSAAALDAARDSLPATARATPALKEAAAPKPSAPKAPAAPRAKAPAAKPPAPKTPAGTAPAPKPPSKTPSSGTVVTAPAAPSAAGKRPEARPAPRVKVDSTALEFAVTARLAHEPLTRAIARRTRNPELAERAAWAVTREAGRLRMSPSLLAAVLLVENRQLDSAAVSSQGAIGLMQVMPIHAGSYGCESADLMNVDANICHGARILHLYMVRSRSVTVALKRYNGCVRGANTPRCYRYPVRVLATASRLRRDILAAAEPGDRRVRM
ncbi:MAG TPA: lytic transglycosylase domain-containing protein, partial [Gemmatimonadales bacterium]|nr:lytic transglycosylase domain-containing protein [Gemmatimonadales bacterium]